MKSLIQQLPHTPHHATGTILVIGAGGGGELAALRALGSQRLILVEAHPRQAEDLASHIDASRGEEVWPLAITALPAQQATLHILNNMRHSSLKLPIALEQHYPNLRVVGEIQVPARSLGESIQSLGLETDSHFLLVIDAPGQASEMLDATPASLLQSFAWIIVRCGAEPLYAGAKGARDTLAALKEIGFEVESENADALYPQTEVLLKRDDSRVRLGRLEAQLQQFDEERAAQMKAAAARESQVKVLTQERDEQAKLATQHKAELDKTAQTATEQQKLAADRHAQIQKLTRERDEQAKLAAQLKSAADKAAQSAAEQQKLADDRQAQIQSLTQQCNEQQNLAADHQTQIQQAANERNRTVEELTGHKKELGSLEAQLNKAKEELAKLTKSDVTLKQELAETRRTASLSVRLQTLREEDLRDLQDRYETVLQKQTSQQQLLVKLSERLATAAGYFHQLASTESQAAPHHGDARKKQGAGESASSRKMVKRIERGS